MTILEWNGAASYSVWKKPATIVRNAALARERFHLCYGGLRWAYKR